VQSAEGEDPDYKPGIQAEDEEEEDFLVEELKSLLIARKATRS